MPKRPSAANTIVRFILTAIVVYAFALWGWSYLVPPYTGIVTAIANEELHIVGLENVTKLGPSLDPAYEIAVYHRDAADMQDSLFDFKLESLRSHMPMLLALVLAMPIALKRKIKAVLMGVSFLIVIDSLASVVVMTWSYTFLPDQHTFSPFKDSAFRNSIVSFLYDFYNAIGVGFIPIIIWILVSVRKKDVSRLFEVRAEKMVE
ncbi:MAG: hypothetical protein HY033_05615 [Ignavibacteriae bacterium]|nr:hypothetical protein [Ignavibacteria bacterium]MBI3364367.1 hypothetical protein [Ignavibacteriota bacterium]